MECKIILLFLFIYYLCFYKKESFDNMWEWWPHQYATFGKDFPRPTPTEKKMIIPDNYYKDCLAKKYDSNKNIKNKYTKQLKGFTQLEYVDQLSKNNEKIYNEELGPITKFNEPMPVPPDYYI